MKRLFLLFTTACVWSCNADNSTAGKTTNQSDSIIPIKTAAHSPIQVATGPSIKKEDLLGLWSDGSSENATFDIQQDSIYYTDESVTYPYYLHGDSLTIRYPDMSFEGKVSIVRDTMVLSDPEFGTSKYVRFKQ